MINNNVYYTEYIVSITRRFAFYNSSKSHIAERLHYIVHRTERVKCKLYYFI